MIGRAGSEIHSLVPLPGCGFIKVDIVDMYTNMDRVRYWAYWRYFGVDWYAQYGTLRMHNMLLLWQCLELCLDKSVLLTYGGKVYLQLRGLPQGAYDSEC